ncbi:MAG: hypothetical protein A3F40_02110 [Chlamydiae bacterium RIFCSPHIGHO2_12_FULL_27_8]|nr:MAG: hypothetical protein A3F40_02110 [Chlamydiae bacterium RIFCSPHIGHO2_12_FULL_27_8]OGN65855.1 MAG: hypothetical protein A2888_03375 [Chlamydiae bacterium RIFCSPLOWO2_01_FULL_28_7]
MINILETFSTAKYFFENGFYQHAKNKFVEILKERPFDIDSIYALSICFYKLKEYTNAIKMFDIFLYMKKDPEVLLYKAESLFSINEPSKAIFVLEEAKKYADESFLNNKISILINQNRQKI